MSFKINIGDATEDEVQRSVESAFSPLFVFRAPRKDEDQEEVTDVLVPWDDVALVIQVKAQAVGASGADVGNSLRWAKKNLSKAGRQVAGAIRAIRDGRMTHMENPLRGRAPFPSHEIKWLYGVIVLHHVSPAYDPFQLVPELQQTTVPLHVLSFRDFQNLAYFLDTPVDLINYFEERSSVLLPTLRPQVHEEEAVFRYWLGNLESLTAFRAANLGESCTEEDVRVYAEHLRRLWAGALPEAGLGGVIDHMIARAHEHDPSLAPPRRSEEVMIKPSDPVSVAAELSKIPRVRRIALGRRYWRTIWRAAEHQSDAMRTTYSRSRNECMLFLASPLPITEREERRNRLLDYTEMLKHYRQVRKAIGIATEAGEDAGRSYDFVVIEHEPIENAEAFLAAQEFFCNEEKLLSADLP